MKVFYERIKKPVCLLLLVLLLLNFLMMVLLLIALFMGASEIASHSDVFEEPPSLSFDYSYHRAQLLKSSPCKGVSPGLLSSWQPVFIVVITAHPSSTSVHSFGFLRCCLDNKLILQKEDSHTLDRSILSFARRNRKVRFLLQPLLSRAARFIPSRFRPGSPLLFRATPSLRRLLTRRESSRIMFKIRSLLKTSPFKTKPDQISILKSSDEAADLWVTASFLTGRLYDKQATPLAVTDLEGGDLKVAIPISSSKLPSKIHSKSKPTLSSREETRSRRKRRVEERSLKSKGKELMDAKTTAREVFFTHPPRNEVAQNGRLFKSLPLIKKNSPASARENLKINNKNREEKSKERFFPTSYSRKREWKSNNQITDPILENSKTSGSFRKEKSSSISNFSTFGRGRRSLVVNETSRSSSNQKLFLLPESKFDFASRRLEVGRGAKAHLYFQKVEGKKSEDGLFGQKKENVVSGLTSFEDGDFELRSVFYDLFYDQTIKPFDNSMFNKVKTSTKNQKPFSAAIVDTRSFYIVNKTSISETSSFLGAFTNRQNSFDRTKRSYTEKQTRNQSPLKILERNKKPKNKNRKNNIKYGERNRRENKKGFPSILFYKILETRNEKGKMSDYNKNKDRTAGTKKDNKITIGGNASRREGENMEKMNVLQEKRNSKIGRQENPDTECRLPLGSLETNPDVAESDPSTSSGVQNDVICAKCLGGLFSKSASVQLGQIQLKLNSFLPLRGEKDDARGREFPSDASNHLQKGDFDFIEPFILAPNLQGAQAQKDKEGKGLNRRERFRRGADWGRQQIPSDVTTRCSPTKKFQIFAKSFPLGIYPARVTVLLGNNSMEDATDNSSSSAATPAPPHPPKRRSDIFPEDEYYPEENLSHSRSTSLNDSSEFSRSFLTPPPEPRGPGPPDHSPSNPFGMHESTHSSGGIDKQLNINEKINDNESVPLNGHKENESGSPLNSSTTQGVWRMETLHNVKNVVDSILRAIGSSNDEFHKNKENETKKDKESVNRRNNPNSKLPLQVELKKEEISLRSNQKKTPHSRPKQDEETNQTLLNSSSGKVPENNLSTTAKGNAGTISSVTDLLFTVPNLRVIQPVENSNVDSAIKSTEKLVLTSLTDLLYSAPTKHRNSSISGKGQSSAREQSFPVKGSARGVESPTPPPERLSKPLDELIIESSCIPVGSRGRFTINDLAFKVVGRNVSDRREKCWNEVETVVENYINVPVIKGNDFLASGAFYFVAQKAKLIDSNSSCGFVTPSDFLEVANEVCSKNNSSPTQDPLACLDYQFMGVLLVQGFKLSLHQEIMVCDFVGGFLLRDALGAAINFLQRH